MADDNNSDRLLSEPPEFPTKQQQRDRTGSMSLGDDHLREPMNGESTTGLPPGQADVNAKEMHDVVNSELGVSTLLNRLKQSIASCKVGPL